MIPYEECDLYKTVLSVGKRDDIYTNQMIFSVGTRFNTKLALSKDQLLDAIYRGEDKILEEMLLEKLKHSLWFTMLEACGIEYEDLQKLEAVQDIPLDALLSDKERRERRLLP